MNSTLRKALTASLLTLGSAVPVLAQFNFDNNCTDPNNTAPWSPGFNAYHQFTELFQAGIGISGTVTDKFCPLAPNPGAIAVTGRIGFSIGPTGTKQDDDFSLTPKDDHLRLTWWFDDETFADAFNEIGRNISLGSGAGFSFARIYERSATGAVTNGLYAGGGMSLAFVGASNRYMYTESTNNGVGGVDARCVIDVLADTARVSWQLTNTTTGPLGLGLWYGAMSVLTLGAPDTTDVGISLNGAWNFTPEITIPGEKPRFVQQRWIRNNDPVNFPAYCNFTLGNVDPFKSIASSIQPWGLQVINQPTPNVSDENGQSDQTPVDEFAVGDVDHLLSGRADGNSNPTFTDFIFPDASLYAPYAAYVQKWQPTVTVPAGQSRTIISYYRSVTGDSNYANGYSAVVDTPKAVNVSASDPTSFQHNPFTIHVWIDNTGGFGIVNQTLPLTNVQVTLQLPQGLSAVGNPGQQTLTQFINIVNPVEMTSVDFQVQADPTVYGFQQYIVTISPTPGAKKVIQGRINFETTPLLLIRPGPNLVSPPWQFGDPTWATVLSPLQQDLDFQSFEWDPVAQDYIISTGASRAKGAWILSTQDLGFKALGGSPSVPADMFPSVTLTSTNAGGVPPIQLQQGWNLVGNPYPYPIPLGQLVGAINQTNSGSLTYAEMVAQNVIDGAFAYYDQDSQTYLFQQQGTDYLQPNVGYWVFSNQNVSLSFGPVQDLFDRASKPAAKFRQGFNQWRFQLSAVGPSSNELVTYAGFARDRSVVQSYNARRSPINPSEGAIRAYITSSSATPVGVRSHDEEVRNATKPGLSTSGTQYAELLHNVYGRQTYTYNVFTRKAGPITIKWPNLNDIPTNLGILITDLHTHRQINPRAEAGYTFLSPENTQRSFQVQITPLGTVRQSISSVSTSVKPAGSVRNMTISYDLSSRGAVSMYIYQGETQVGTIVVDKDVLSGQNQIVWPMVLQNGTSAPSGDYTLKIDATGEGGDTATRLVRVHIP